MFDVSNNICYFCIVNPCQKQDVIGSVEKNQLNM